MLESGLSGSVRGVPSNGHPYRDPGPNPDIALEQFIERFMGCRACKAAEGRAVLYLRPRAAGRLRGIKS
jgi:hypothetical protein